MKTGNDFREAAIKNNIKFWGIHNCSMCDYECGYIFFKYEDCEVVYDSGCDCTRGYRHTDRNWDDVANQYNINIENEVTIKEYDKYWNFDM